MKQYAATDYDGRSVEAARRVLLELTRVLGEYEEEITVVGGWVPPLLMPNAGQIVLLTRTKRRHIVLLIRTKQLADTGSRPGSAEPGVPAAPAPFPAVSRKGEGVNLIILQ